jgi:hypothetical protein
MLPRPYDVLGKIFVDFIVSEQVEQYITIVPVHKSCGTRNPLLDLLPRHHTIFLG